MQAAAKQDDHIPTSVVDASATSRRRGCIGVALVYVNPSVNPPCGVLPAPRPGSLLDCASTNYKPALKGDSSRARPVGDAARGESGGIGSIASSSEARRPYSNQRCGCECNEQTEGLYRGCSCLRQPLSQSALRRIASSPAGEPFGAALYAKIYELTPRLEQGRLTHCRS